MKEQKKLDLQISNKLTISTKDPYTILDAEESQIPADKKWDNLLQNCESTLLSQAGEYSYCQSSMTQKYLRDWLLPGEHRDSTGHQTGRSGIRGGGHGQQVYGTSDAGLYCASNDLLQDGANQPSVEQDFVVECTAEHGPLNNQYGYPPENYGCNTSAHPYHCGNYGYSLNAGASKWEYPTEHLVHEPQPSNNPAPSAKPSGDTPLQAYYYGCIKFGDRSMAYAGEAEQQVVPSGYCPAPQGAANTRQSSRSAQRTEWGASSKLTPLASLSSYAASQVSPGGSSIGHRAGSKRRAGHSQGLDKEAVDAAGHHHSMDKQGIGLGATRHQRCIGGSERNRREKRKEQNRRAAKKCREKRKRAVDRLALEYNMMKQENAELRGQLEVMKGTVSRLQRSLQQSQTKTGEGSSDRGVTERQQL